METTNMTFQDLMRVYIGDSWYKELIHIMKSEFFEEIARTIQAERRSGITIYPESPELIFRAFRETPADKLKVVILGQDPYHDGSYDGLAFSNGGKTKPSPSLVQILDEVERQVGGMSLEHEGRLDLSRWAHQGVLLLNAALTVRRGVPNSHSKLWQKFTQSVLGTISDMRNGIIFLLWGNSARSYIDYLNPFAHIILECGHPASAAYNTTNNSWMDNHHFETVNNILRNRGDNIIIW